ncbi:MAG: peptidyl-prolyl cis-trans isomerase SurA [Flavobacteriales bacterium]|jgi:peptidyl-prolyl cis-trans isomerase SurA
MYASIKLFVIAIVTGLILPSLSVAQPTEQEPEGQSIDRIVAVVGANIATQSELETQYLQMLSQGIEPDDLTRCRLFEELLYQKLLLNQAQVDSVDISDSQVEDELGRRLDYFIAQIGSQEKLEEYYEKSILEIKDEFRKMIRDQLLVQNMQQKLTADVKVTPSEVRRFFAKIPADSLPYVNSEIQLGRIMIKPKISQDQLDEARHKAEDLRQRVLDGEKFSTLAVLYSEDPGSSKKGGDLGFFARGQMVPEFESVAFRMKNDSVSDIFKTEYGYHFMQMIERRGEQANVRHILIKSKPSIDDIVKASELLDSLKKEIELERMDFEDAATKYSEDEDSRLNKGMMYNTNTGSTVFEMDQLSMIDQRLFLKVEKMELGSITEVMDVTEPDGTPSYNIFNLKSRTEPHVANLKEDYQKIQTAALAEKQNNMIGDWIVEKAARTYIMMDPLYENCPFNNNWIQEAQ